MIIHIDWTLQDFKDMASLQKNSSFVLNFANWFVAILFPVIGIFNMINGKFFVSGLFFTIVGGVVLYSLTLDRFIRVRKAFKTFEPKTQSVTADASGLSGSTSTTNWSVGWSHFSKYVETKRLFALSGNKSELLCFPKRAFANQAEIEQFRAWASGIGQKEMPLVAPIPEP